MPAKSARQYKFMQMIAHGGTPSKGSSSKKNKLKSLTPEVAREFVMKTPPAKRKLFSKR